MSATDQIPEEAREVLDFWFPDDGHDKTVETHGAFWQWRMRGGADEAIIERFSDLTERGARGQLDRSHKDTIREERATRDTGHGAGSQVHQIQNRVKIIE